MAVEVFAADEQRAAPVDTLRWVRLAEAVLADEGIRGDAELSMLFVDEDAISDLNQRFLGKSGPTDVLAFPIDEEPAESGRSPDSGGTGPGFSSDPDEIPVLLGDVVICPAVAMRNAPDHAGTYEDELALLIVHGVLHLLGLDHVDEDEAEVMEARERELLSRYNVRSGSTPPTDPSQVGAAAQVGATVDHAVATEHVATADVATDQTPGEAAADYGGPVTQDDDGPAGR